jgi:hypothetical protein
LLLGDGVSHGLPQWEAVPGAFPEVETHEEKMEPPGDGKLDPGILGQTLDIHGTGDVAQDIQFPAFKGEYLRVRIAVDHHVKLFDFRAPDVIRVETGLGAKCGRRRKNNRKKRKEKPQEIFHGNPPFSFGREDFSHHSTGPLM